MEIHIMINKNSIQRLPLANGCHYKRSFGNETLFFFLKVQFFCLCPKKERFICIIQKKVVILQRKMNRALVAKKVLQYLAHAEGVCLWGGGKYRTY